MLETALVALATFFATVGPLDVAAIFAGLTATASADSKRSIALRGTFIAALILIGFALAGEPILASLGISLAAFRTAGGILLLLIGIDMVFVRQSGGVSATDEERREAAAKLDIAVFPLATPLIAGPGTMGAIVLLMAEAKGDPVQQLIVVAALLLILLLTLATLLLASQVTRLFGVTGMHVVNRILGILLAALAVQFIFDGILQSGMLAGT